MSERFTLYDLIFNIATLTSMVSLVFGCLIFLKSEFGIKAIVLLVLVSVVVDIILMFCNEFVGAVVSRTFSLLEFTLISTFFYANFKGKFARSIVVVGIAVFPLVVFFDAFSQSQKLRDDLVTVCESIILVSYSVAILYMWMKNIRYEKITSAPQFWIVSAILFYFGGNIFVFGSSNYASSISRDAFDFVWTIHASIVVIYYVSITLGFWRAKKAYQ